MLTAAYQNNAPPASLSRPQGAAAAYGSVIRDTEDPREIEYRVLARATALLDLAGAEDAGPADLPAAIHENRMVWIAFTSDIASEANSFDNALKANILSLARWVFAESDRVLRDGRDPRALADINRAIMTGLRPGATPETGMS